MALGAFGINQFLEPVAKRLGFKRNQKPPLDAKSNN
jgi:hypothetical protein